MAAVLSDIRCWKQSGKHLLAASISPFDSQRSSASVSCCSSEIGFNPYQSARSTGYDAVAWNLWGRH
jgi:hypothetical protein